LELKKQNNKASMIIFLNESQESESRFMKPFDKKKDYLRMA
jgi:hypothetical protein